MTSANRFFKAVRYPSLLWIGALLLCLNPFTLFSASTAHAEVFCKSRATNVVRARPKKCKKSERRVRKPQLSIWGSSLHIDSYSTETLGEGEIAAYVNVEDTGNVTEGTDSNTALNVSIARLGATGGTINSTGLNIAVVGDTGGDSTVTGLSVDVGGADLNYAAIFQGGNVGIGVADPDERLEINGRIHLDESTAPAETTDKLYNVGGVLFWNGSSVSTADTGDVTSVMAGMGLTGGGNSGDIMLEVDVGTTANKILQLNGAAEIPPVSGANLTNLNASNLTLGTVDDARLSPNVSLLGSNIDLATEVTGTLPVANGGTGATTLNDLITLGTHTTGNYVTNVANGTGIAGGSVGSEGASLTLSIDQAFSPTWTGNHNFSGNVALGDSNADSLSIASTLQGNLTFEGTTADAFETTLAITDPTADRLIALPDASGTIALVGSPVAGYLLDTGDTGTGDYIFTGTMDFTGTDMQGSSPLVFEGATDDAFETTFTLTDPTVDRTVTFPDVSGEVTLLGQTIESSEITDATIANADIANDAVTLGTQSTGNYVATIAGSSQVSVAGSGSETAAVTLGITNDSIGPTQIDETAAYGWSGAHTFGSTLAANGNVTLGDAASDTLSIASTLQNNLTFEGSTDDAFETTFGITDPTADRLIVFPDASGTVALAGSSSSGFLLNTGDTGNGPYVFTGTMDFTGTALQGGSPLVLEGATTDGFETTLSLDDPTGDNTITFPDTSGEITLLGQDIALGSEVTGVLPVLNGGTGSNTLNDLITLGTHTTGNYVANVANGTGISGGSAGSESAALTLSVDQAFTPTWTGAHIFSNTLTANGNVTLGDAATDTLSIASVLQNDLTFEGATDDGFETTLSFADPTADRTITFPNASGTVALSGSSASGFLLDTGDTGAGAYVFTGTMDFTGTDMQGASPLVFEGGTDDAFETTFTLADPTADHTITFPDLSGEVSLLGQTIESSEITDATIANADIANDAVALATQTTGNYVGNVASGTGISGGSAGSENASLTLSVDQSFTPTWTGAHVFSNTVTANGSVAANGDVTLGDAASDTLSIASTLQNNLTFEGATPDAFETTLALTDPTADRTITFPDASGTVALSGSSVSGFLLDTGDTGAGAYVFTGTMDFTGTDMQGASPLVFEGGTADAFETTFTLADPTADQTITFPDLSGEVSLLGQTIESSEITDATIANADIANDAVALATQTTGNYVGNVASGTGISGGSAGSENASLTLSIDQAFTPTWTGAHIFSNTVTANGSVTANGNVTIGDAVTDNLTITSTLQGATPLILDGATDNTNELTLAVTDPTADRTITFPDASGTVALSGSSVSGFLLDTGDTGTGAYTFTGTMDFTGTDMQGASPLVFEGGTDDAFETTFTLADPTADHTITFPDLSGEVSLLGQTIESSEITDGTIANADIANNAVTLGTQSTGNYVATIAGSSQVSVSGSGSETAAVTLGISDDSIGPTQIDETATYGWSGAHTFGNTLTANGNTVLGDAATDTLSIASTLQNNLIFEGATPDAFETTLALTDPTADRTITFPDASGTVALSGSSGSGFLLDTGDTGAGAYVFTGTMDFTGTDMQGASPFVFEGGTDDAFETTFTLTDPTADRTVTFPDVSGEVTLLGQTIESSEITDATIANADIANDAVALATQTTGNYVGNVASGTGISGGSAGSENASLTLSVDQSFTPTWTGAHIFSNTLTANNSVAANGNVTIGDAVTDNLTITSAIQGATPLVLDGATDNTNELTLAVTDPTADRTITFPDASGTVALSGSSASGFLLDTGDTGAGAYVFTGTMDFTGTDMQGSSPLVFEGGTDDAFETTFTLVDPTTDNTVTFPDLSGEVTLLGQTIDLTSEITGTLPVGNGGTGATTLNDLITLGTHTTGNYVANVASGTGISGGSAGSESASLSLSVDQSFTPTWTGAHVFSNSVTANGNVTLGDAASDTLSIASTLQNNLIFEGATPDAFETTLALTDPTADRTITFPDASGTVALTGDAGSGYLLDTGDTGAGAYVFTGTMDFTGTVMQGASPVVMEGSTADAFETTLALTDPTADRTITLPNASGEVSVLGQTIESSEITDATVANADIANDAITLATQTTGNFVQNVASGTGISGGSAGSENASLTLSVDQAFTPTWTGAHVFSNTVTANGNITLGDAASDTLSIAATLQNNLIFEGATADAFETTLALTDATADRTITFPDASGTVALTGDAGSGYLLDTGDTGAGAYVFTGTMDFSGTDLQGASPLVMEGSTADTFETTLALTDPTADRTITLPNASGEVSVLGQTIESSEITDATVANADIANDAVTLATQTTGNFVQNVASGTGISGGSAGSENASLTLSVDQAFTPTWTGAHAFSNTVTANGNVTVGDAASDTLSIVSTLQNNLIFEGATPDAFETTLALTDATADRTITFPDASGTVALTGDAGSGYLLDTGDTGAGAYVFTGTMDFTATDMQGASPLVFEGGTADAFETTFTLTDPTADRTVTFPDVSGEVTVLGQTIESSEITDATVANADIANDAVALATQTTGNFVGNVASGTGISGGSAGSENASLTLSIDQAFTPTWTGAHVFSNTLTANGNTVLGDAATDTLSIVSTLQNNLIFEGATPDAFETTLALTDATADRTITFPDASGTVALTGDAGSGYLLDTGDTGAGAYTFTGTMDFTGTVMQGASPVVMEGSTADAFETTLALTDPTADRTITLPNASGEVSVLGQTIESSEITDATVANADIANDAVTLATQTTGNFVQNVASGAGISGGSAGSENASLTLSVDQAFTPTWTGAHVFSNTITANNTLAANAGVTIGDAVTDNLTITSALQGASPLVLDGATDDTNELTLAVTDPTADRTITFPDASGTMALTGDAGSGYLLDTGDTGAGAYVFTGTMDFTGTVMQGASPVVMEGSTADAFETTLALTDPTADRTITLPNASGEVSVLGQTIESSEITDATVANADIANDAVTLATQTTGNFVQNVASGTGISGGSAGSENASLTLSVDQAFTPTWTGAHVFSNTVTANGNVTVGDAASDTLSIVSTLQNNLIFEGATADAFETTLALTDATADRTITFPDASGTVALTGDAGSGYLLDTGDTGAGTYVFTGTMDFTATDMQGASPLVFEGGTADAFETTFTLTDPTADRTVTFPDVSGEVTVLGQTIESSEITDATVANADIANDAVTLATQTTGNFVQNVASGTGISGGSAGSENASLTLSVDQAFTPTWTGAHIFSNTVTANGNVTVGDAASDTLSIVSTLQNNLIFEGVTADAFETTLALTDPTADRTITFPDASGTVALTGDAGSGYLLDTGDTGAGAYTFTGTMDLSGTDLQGASPLVMEGATADAFETTLALTDPTADRTITLPNASGEVSVLGQTIESSEITDGTVANADIANDAVTLATQTTGNFVQNVASGTGISGGSAGSENASLTLSVDQAFTPTWTGAHIFSNTVTANGNMTVGDASSDTLSIVSTLQNNLIFEGATADAFETTLALTDATADRTITFPDASGTVALTGDAGSGYLLDTGDTGAGAYTFTGTMDLSGTDLQGASPLVMEGATADAFETTLALTDPTADRTITLPNASGEVSVLGQTIESSEITDGTVANADIANDAVTLATQTTGNFVQNVASGTGISGGSAGSENASLTLSVDQAFTPTWTGAHIFSNTVTANGNVTVGDAASDTLSIVSTLQNNLIFEGATADAFETTLALTDPTADRTITFPDASGTVALTGDAGSGYLLDTGDTGAGTYVFTGTMDFTGTVMQGASPVVMEGSTADAFETTLALTDPTADHTITLPNASGEVSVLGQTIESSEITDATVANADIANDAVTLATQTTGNFVQNVASGTGISGGSAGSENASLTLSVDQAFTPTWTGAHVFSNTVTANGNVVVGDATTDTLSIASTLQNNLIFEGATPDAFETTLALTDATADRTITFPDASGTVALTGDAGSGYLLDTGDTGAGAYVFTGTMDFTATDMQGASPLVFEGGTADAFETTFTLTDPTADRTVTFPDVSGEVTVLGQTIESSEITDATVANADIANDAVALATQTTGNFVGNVASGTGISGGSAGSENASLTLSIDQAFTPTWTGAHVFSNTLTANGNTVLGDAATDTLSIVSTLQNNLIFEGATPDAFETTLALTDATADRTITFPDASGTVALTGDAGSGYLLDTGDTGAGAYTFTGTMDFTGTVMQGASPVVMEGSTADAFETTLALTDPTADRTITLPNASGEVSVLGQTIESSEITDATVANADIANDAVTLGTQSTGNYVATVAGSSQISVSGSGSETAAVTLGISNDSIGPTQIDETGTYGWSGVHTFSNTLTANGNTVLGDAATDTLSIVSTLQNNLIFEGATPDAFETTLALTDATADRTITFPDASGTVALTGDAGSGYLLDTGDTGAGAYVFTGTMDLTGTAMQGASPVVLEGSTADAFETTLALTDPTADRTITLPDASGEVSLLGQTIESSEITDATVANADIANDAVTLATQTTGNFVGNVASGTGISGGSAGSENASLTLSVDQSFTPTWTGAHVFSNTVTANSTLAANAGVTIGDAVTDNLTIAGAIQGASPLILDGATDDTNEMTLAVTDPTADRTITFPDASGTVALTGDAGSGYLLDTGDTGAGAYVFTGTMDFTGTVMEGASPVVMEGSTADAFETTLALTDPTADRTITLPNASGEVSVLGQTIESSEITDATVANADIANDAVTLATQTTGNFVQNVASGTGISGGSAGSENASLTLSVDQAFTPTWTGAHVFSNTVTANGNVTVGDAASDTLSIASTLQNNLIFEGATPDAFETTLAMTDATADRTITFPDASGTVALTGDAGSGYLLDTGDTGAGAYVFTGTMDFTGTDMQGASPLVFEGGTDDAFETTLALTDPTADRTVTLPDASGEISLLGQTIESSEIADATIANADIANDAVALATQTTGNYVGNVASGTGISGGSAGSENASLTLSVDQSFTPTWTGAHVFSNTVTANGNMSIGDAATDTLSIASTLQNNLIFEGATPDAFETTLAMTDATADRTITFPDASGTVALTGDAGSGYLLDIGDTGTGDYVFAGTMDFTGTVMQGASPVVMEGSTDDGFETTLALSDPTADRTITLPDASGVVSLLGQSIESSEIADATIANADIANDAVTLGAQTTGNYVASLVAGTAIDVGAAAEGGTPTIDWDSTEVGTTTFGSGSGMTWTFDASGGTDTAIAFGNGTINVTSGALQVDGVPVLTSETDGVIGNEVANATNATLTRSGAGTGGDPYTLGLNLANANTWTAAINSTATNASGGSATPINVTSTLAAMNGSDSFIGVDLNLTNADHTGAGNTVTGLNIAGITGDAQATEYAISVSSGWDRAISAEGSSVFTLGAADSVLIDAASTDSTTTAGALAVKLDTATDGAAAISIDLENTSTATAGNTSIVGMMVSPTQSASGLGGTHQTIGYGVQDVVTTGSLDGDQVQVGMYVGNQGAVGTEQSIGLAISPQSGSDRSYGAIIMGGVGIGNDSPNGLLTVGSGGKFEVDNNGNLSMGDGALIDLSAIVANSSTEGLKLPAYNAAAVADGQISWDATANKLYVGDGSSAIEIGSGGGSGDVTAVGDCSTGACFGGASGTTLTSTTGEVLNLATANTLIYERNDGGAITFAGKDDAGAADTIYDTTGAGAITVGSADVTSVTVTTDGTGTGEVVLPNDAIGVAEFAEGTAGQLLLSNATPETAWVSMSGDVNIDGAGATTIQANAVALTTDTAGNYVASVTNGDGITGGNGGSEGAALTLAVDQNAAFTWTTDHDWSLAGSENIGIASTGLGTDIFNVTGSSLTNGSAVTITGPSGGTAGMSDSLLKVEGDVGNVGSAQGLISSTAVFDASSAQSNNLAVFSSVTGSATNRGIKNTLTDDAANANEDYGIHNLVTVNGDTSATKTAFGIYSSVYSDNENTDQGTRNEYAGYFEASGTTRGTNTAYALYASATGADFNYAGIFENGNVGIGDTSPTALLTVGSGDKFQVSSSGNVTMADGTLIDLSGITANSGTEGLKLPAYHASAVTDGQITWDATANKLYVGDGASALEIGGGGGSGDVTAVGDCSTGACFGGASGTALTSTTGEILDLATANTLIYQRNDSGAVTFAGKDDAGAADTVYDTTGAGAITVGSSDVTSITLTTDSTGTGEVMLPNDSVGVAEIAQGTAGQLLMSNTIPDTAWVSMSGDIAIDGNGNTAIQAGAVLLGTDTSGNYVEDITAGNAIDVTDGGASGAVPTVAWDSTEVGTTTFGSGSGITWTFDASGGTDPTLAFGNGLVTVGTGSQVVASNLGIEFTESDTNPSCASGNYSIFADASESKLKKCVDGVTSDLAPAGGGGITDLTADAGGATSGTSVTLAGGTNGIDTSRSSDTVTFNLDTTEIGSATFGSGSGITWTFDAGATDPTVTFGSDSIALGNSTSIAAGKNFSMTSGAGTFTQTFTGTTTDAMTLTAGSLTTGQALEIVGPSGGTAGGTDALIKLTTDMGLNGTTTGAISSTVNADAVNAGSGSTNNLYLSTTSTASGGGNTGIRGIYNYVEDGAASAASAIGIRTLGNITATASNSSTKTAYGISASASSSNSFDTGARNVYAGYFDASGDTNGTTTTYGVYATASGGDTNYALYIAAGAATFADSTLLDLSAINASSTTEGLFLPQNTSCTSATAEGQVCWDSDSEVLNIGTGSSRIFLQENKFLINGATGTSSSATFYVGPAGIGSNATEANVRYWEAPVALSISSIRASVQTAPSGGNSWTVQLYKNGSAVTGTCSISGTSDDCTITYGTPTSIAAGDRLTVGFTEVGTATGTGGSAFSMVCQ